MSENMRIWDALSKTDPKHTKPFSRAGGFKGTATKPIWLTMRLTQHFGPCGVGWGMEKPEFQVVNAGDEILVFCTVALWYTDGATGDNRVYGVGGDKVLGKNKNGPFTNDEAFKASYTDALSNAMKQIGVAADIHMGMFDDTKYRDEVAREFAQDADKDIERLAGKDAARDPVTGELLNNYQVNKAKKAEQAIETLKLSAKLAMSLCTNKTMLLDWWSENGETLLKELPDDDFDAIKADVKRKRAELPELEKVA